MQPSVRKTALCNLGRAQISKTELGFHRLIDTGNRLVVTRGGGGGAEERAEESFSFTPETYIMLLTNVTSIKKKI